MPEPAIFVVGSEVEVANSTFRIHDIKCATIAMCIMVFNFAAVAWHYK